MEIIKTKQIKNILIEDEDNEADYENNRPNPGEAILKKKHIKNIHILIHIFIKINKA